METQQGDSGFVQAAGAPEEEPRAAASEEERWSSSSVFECLDANRDGFVSIEELSAWTQRLGHPLSPDSVLALIQDCDRDHDGRLTLDEFLGLTRMLELEGGGDSSSMREAFQVFDRDGDGLISPLELGTTLSDLGLLASETSLSRIQSMIRKVDSDGDGEVSFSEFQIMMMMNNPNHRTD